MTVLAYAWIVGRRILTAGRGAPWILALGLACAAPALVKIPDSDPALLPPAVFPCLLGFAASSAVAAFAPCAFLAFSGSTPLDVAVASRPLRRLGRAVGAAAGSAAAAVAIAAAFAAAAVCLGDSGVPLRRRIEVPDVKPQVMRREGDSVTIANPRVLAIRFFPQIGFARGYSGDWASFELSANGRSASRVEIGSAGSEPFESGGLAGVAWMATHVAGTLPVFWPRGSAVVVGRALDRWEAMAILLLQTSLYLALLASASAVLGITLESPVATQAAAVLWLLGAASALPEPLAPFNRAHFVDVQDLSRGLVAPVDIGAAGRAAASIAAALAASVLLRRKLR